MFSSFKSFLGGQDTDIQQLSPRDLLELDPDSYIILDVREAWEIEIAAIPNTTTIPLGMLHNRIHELDHYHEKKIICLCHHGGRSQRSATFLKQNGFHDIANLAGGIDAWSIEIDKTLRRY